jgi:hypothetical protein
MTPHHHLGTSTGACAEPAGRASADAALKATHVEQTPPRARPRGLGAPHVSHPESAPPAFPFEGLWDTHGSAVYALACALLGDETAAAKALTLGMADFARSPGSTSLTEARRSWARHVYWRSQELAGETSGTPLLPSAVIRLREVGQLQRACLALCLFGGQSHREAAALLGVPSRTVADSLTAGLREVQRLAAGRTRTSA